MAWAHVSAHWRAAPARPAGGRPWRRCQRQLAARAAQPGAAQPSALDCSRSLAAVRAAEAGQASPLVADPYAADLVSRVGQGSDTGGGAWLGQSTAASRLSMAQLCVSGEHVSTQAFACVQAGSEGPAAGAGAAAPAAARARDAIVARFLDEQLLKAAALANMERKQASVRAYRTWACRAWAELVAGRRCIVTHESCARGGGLSRSAHGEELPRPRAASSLNGLCMSKVGPTRMRTPPKCAGVQPGGDSGGCL